MLETLTEKSTTNPENETPEYLKEQLLKRFQPERTPLRHRIYESFFGPDSRNLVDGFLQMSAIVGIPVADVFSGANLINAFDKATQFMGDARFLKGYSYFAALTVAIAVTYNSLRTGMDLAQQESDFQKGITEFMKAEYKVSP
jgi:hypothetical protein